MSLMSYILGMEIQKCAVGIFLSEKKYAMDILKKFGMDRCKEVASPLVQNAKLSKDDGDAKANPSFCTSLIGSLLYLTATRPNIMFAANLLSRFMISLSVTHFTVAKSGFQVCEGHI